MDAWIGFLFLSGACFCVGVVTYRRSRAIPEEGSELVKLPEVWNDVTIGERISRLTAEPPQVISHFVTSMMDRFVVRQDDQTALTRIRFLQTRIEQLKSAKKYQSAMDELSTAALERDIRLANLEGKKEEIENRRQHERQTARLHTENEKLKLAIENTRLKQELGQVKTSLHEQEQIRKHHSVKARVELETRLSRQWAEKKAALEAIPPEEAERHARMAAMWDDAIGRTLEQLKACI